MSMTQVAFLKKADLPTKKEIQDHIQGLGYDFFILEESENIFGQDGLTCSINGHETYFETNFDEPNEITDHNEWIKSDLTNQDTAFSFIWGADYAAGACIGLISISLIDKSQALIYYLDDQMKYSRDMLSNDTPEFLKGLEAQKQSKENHMSNRKMENDTMEKKSFWSRIKAMFK